MSGDQNQRKISAIRPSSSREQAKNAETKATDIQQPPSKPDLQKLIHLVHSSDVQASNESASALREMLLNGDANLLCGLVNQFVLSNSEKLLDIIAVVRQPLDKVLLEQLAEIWRSNPRVCLSLVNHLILKQVPWLYTFPQHAAFGQFLKSMRSHADDLAYCVGTALVLASLLLLTAPLISQNLLDICNAFIFLANVLHKKTLTPSAETSASNVAILHFRVSLYALFQRLYGLFPCHFLTFLRQNFAGPQVTPENRVLYQDVVKPMLDFVKLHPLLVTTNKEGELSKERWIRKEAHDILAECNRVAGEPYESDVGDDNSLLLLLFRRGLARQSSSSSFFPCQNSQLSLAASSGWTSCKPTPVKDALASAAPGPIPNVGKLNLPANQDTRRQLTLDPISLPSTAQSSVAAQKSTNSLNVQQQQTSYWSPSDAVGLSTPPDDVDGYNDEGRSLMPELRKPTVPERRKTSVAAGPESPAPHMRSFRTGSWGADARQQYLQGKQQGHQVQRQSSNVVSQPGKEAPATRRSFGQAFAKLFHRPIAGSNSVPHSARRFGSERKFDFDFEAAEYRPQTSGVCHYLESSNFTQQAELAEEADEAMASGNAGSLASSKRPSLSEPQLFPSQPGHVRATMGPVRPDVGQTEATASNLINLQELSGILKTLQKENDENLMEDPELYRLLPNMGHGFVPYVQKRQSLSSSRASSSVAIVQSSDRTRHSSTATTTSQILHAAISRHSSLLDTQAIGGNTSRASATPPLVASSQKADLGAGDDRRGNIQPGFIVGVPDEVEEQEVQGTKPRAGTDATDISTNSTTADEEIVGSVPLLSTSQSLVEFMSRVNRMRFDSRCVGENVDLVDGQKAPSLERPLVSSTQQQQSSVAAAAAAAAEFRRRGSTFSGVIARPESCPPQGGDRINSMQPGQGKQGVLPVHGAMSDDFGAKDWTDDQEFASTPYDTLLKLICAQTVAPSAIPRTTPYALLDDYLAAARSAHAVSQSSAESSVECDVVSTPEKTTKSPQSSRKASSSQRKAAANNQQQQTSRDGQKETVAMLKSEIESLRMELALTKQRVFYERHQRLLHAERNRRLYGRLKQTTVMEEQNQAQRDQLRLQDNEIRQLMAALTELRRQNAAQRQDFAGKEFQLTTRLQASQRENETTRSSLIASKRTADDLLLENRRLNKELGAFVQRLFDKEAAYKQLQEQYANELPSSKQAVSELDKQLFLLGAVNQRLREKLKLAKSYQEQAQALKEELQRLEESSKQEINEYRRRCRKEKQKAEAAQQRVQELDDLVRKRQAQIGESKRCLDEASDVHREQLEACQVKYKALMTVCQRQETHILELYEKLEASRIATEKRTDNGESALDAALSSGDAKSNGAVVQKCSYTVNVGVDIPERDGVSSEMRSYDSYHSAGHLPQMSGVVGGPTALSTSAASAGSYRSSDLYLHYLFNPELGAANQQLGENVDQKSMDDDVDDPFDLQ